MRPLLKGKLKRLELSKISALFMTMKIRSKKYVFYSILILLILCAIYRIGLAFVGRVPYAIPQAKTIISSSTGKVCLEITNVNAGHSSMYAATYDCVTHIEEDSLLVKKCARSKIEDSDSQNTRIIFTQDALCTWLGPCTNPRYSESCNWDREVYEIDDQGKFIKVDY